MKSCRAISAFVGILGFPLFLCLPPVISFLPTRIEAQTTAATLSGTVTDSKGDAAPAVSLAVSSDSTGLRRQAMTGRDGAFTIALLPPGVYTLRARHEGFAPVEVNNIELPVGGRVAINIALKVGGIGEMVNVSARPSLMQTESSALAEVVNSRQVSLLPINGRDFRRLTTLVPGTAPRSQNGSIGSFTVNGQREKSNIFLIDGVDNNDSFRNQPSFNQGGVTGAPATLLPVDAIDEFSIQLQGLAEYGRNSGAVVNIALKSGGNELHGSVYNFLRNDNFDARSFFETLPGRTKGEFKNNNFGGVLGGPIVRERAFFFTGYEGQRERVTSAFAVRVPGAKDLAEARAANRTDGRAENPLSARLLGLFPAENIPGAANNLAFAATNRNDSDNFLVKLDHHFGERLTLSGRYIFGDGEQVFPLATGFGSPLPSYQTVVPTRVQLAGLSLTQVFSSQLVNETRVSYNRFKEYFFPLDAGFDPASLGLITGAKSLPTITIAGYVSLGAPTNLPRGRVSSAYQFVDNLIWARGAHTLKFGGEYRRPLVNSYNDVFTRGRINFAGLADFLAGRPAAAGTMIQRGATRRDTFTNNFGLFAQDHWRVTGRLTLNPGLRYEYVGVFTDNGNRLANFTPHQGLLRVGAPGLPALYQPDRNNLAPRIGFAYDLTGRGRTILRGGSGLYYDTPSQDFFLLQDFSPSNPGANPIAGLGAYNVTFAANETVPFGPNIAIFGNGAPPATKLSLFAVDQHLRTPYIHNFNLNLQQALYKGAMLQAAYVGSRGTRLFRLRDINQPRPASPGDPATRQSRRPFHAEFPQFTSINYLETSANSHYHALQLHLKQHLSAGLDCQVAYTWSKSIDDASNGVYVGVRGVSYPQNSFNLRAERGLSNFDTRHRFILNFVYDLDFLRRRLANWPKRLTGGWEVSGFYTLAGGMPVTPFLSVDSSGTGTLNDRPNLIGDPNRGPRRVEAWFDKAAFAKPEPGTFGNAGRNIIIGPGTNIADFSIHKRTRITERIALQFRAEFFNLFNHPNFSLPNADFSSRAFGAIGETPDVTEGNPRLGEGGPRVIQLGLKIIF